VYNIAGHKKTEPALCPIASFWSSYFVTAPNRDLTAKLAERLAQLDRRLSVQETRLTEFQRSLEESQRRRWQLWVALIGSVLSFAGSLVLWFLKK
jgi:hypothetical protein